MSIGLKKGVNNAKKDTIEVEDLNVDETEFNDVGSSNASTSKFPSKLVVVGICIAVVIAFVVVSMLLNRTDSGGSVGDSNTVDTVEGADNTDNADNTTVNGTDNVTTDNQSGASDSNSEQTENSNGVYDENGNTIDPNGINPGAPNYQESTSDTTSATVYNASDFIKDLNGLDISAVYREASVSYVTDYVSYEAHRAIIDNGMELYWLEAEYNGKKYRVQCPFYYFKDLGATGICKVEVEVVNTTDGGKVITYMQVVPDDYTRSE